MFLVISDFPLSDYGINTRIILTNSRFKPPKLPSAREKQLLTRCPGYQESKPPEWEAIESEDREEQEKWMREVGIRGMSWPELFVHHCANHANFIEPEYYVEENGDIVPYSIGKTKFICSACLEFFNIIGGNFEKKYVVPCPGAVLYAGIPVNKYVQVETIKYV